MPMLTCLYRDPMNILCHIRDIQRGVAVFEQQFAERYGISLNEGMALCSISNSEKGKLTSGEIGELLGLTHSNTSKVLSSIEDKEYIKRTLGKKDKRQMFFNITDSGKELLCRIKSEEKEMKMPDVLLHVLANTLNQG